MRLALLLCTLAAAATNWSTRLPGERPHDRRLEHVTKPLTTVLVVILAATSGAPTSQVVTAVVALTLCLAGDVALLAVIDNFVLGLGAFLLGHIAFIVLFAEYGLENGWLGIVAGLLAAGVAVLVGRRIIAGARRTDATLSAPVGAYLGVIMAMAVLGWATGRPSVVAGSALFVVSDAVLGWEEFVGRRRWMPVVVMVTYHAAIVLLALSLH